MKTISIFLLSFLLFAACSPVRNTTAFQRTALVNVSIIDVTNGNVLRGQTVVMAGGRIVDVGPADAVPVDNSTTKIDAGGKYLVPGLWDMHVHLEMATKRSLPYFIAYGITSVRDMGANSFDTIRQWRSEIEGGTRVGPHIVSPGPIIDGPFFVNLLRVTVRTPVEARRAVDSLVDLGVDFIKVHQQISREAYLALADQVAKRHITFSGHKPASVSTREMIEAGQNSIEHLLSTPDLNDTTIAVLKARGVFFTPNLVIIDKIARYNDSSLHQDPRLRQVDPVLKQHWDKQTEAWGNNVSQTVAYMQSIMPDMQRKTAALQKAGVPLLAGTDLGIPYAYPGSSLHEELALLVQAGLSPLEALQTATINPARFFKKETEMGAIRKGVRADLLLLNANPLENIGNLKKIDAVFFNGKLFDRASLDALQK